MKQKFLLLNRAFQLLINSMRKDSNLSIEDNKTINQMYFILKRCETIVGEQKFNKVLREAELNTLVEVMNKYIECITGDEKDCRMTLLDEFINADSAKMDMLNNVLFNHDKMIKQGRDEKMVQTLYSKVHLNKDNVVEIH